MGCWLLLEKALDISKLVPVLTTVHSQKGTYHAIRYHRRDEPIHEQTPSQVPPEYQQVMERAVDWMQRATAALLGPPHSSEEWAILPDTKDHNISRTLEGVKSSAALQGVRSRTKETISRLRKGAGWKTFVEWLHEIPHSLQELTGETTIVIPVEPAIEDSPEQAAVAMEIQNIINRRYSALGSDTILEKWREVTSRALLREPFGASLSPNMQVVVKTLNEQAPLGYRLGPLTYQIAEYLKFLDVPPKPTVVVGNVSMNTDKYVQKQAMEWASRIQTLWRLTAEGENYELPHGTPEALQWFQEIAKDEKRREQYLRVLKEVAERAYPGGQEVILALATKLLDDPPTFLTSCRLDNFPKFLEWCQEALQGIEVTPEIAEMLFSLDAFWDKREIWQQVLRRNPLHFDWIITPFIFPPTLVATLHESFLLHYAVEQMPQLMHSLLSPAINDINVLFKKLERARQEAMQKPKPQYDAIVLSADPASFHALAYPIGGVATCFGVSGGNAHHKYLLAANPYAWTAFWLDKDGKPRARVWGVYHPKSKRLWFTNFYGGAGVNRPKFFQQLEEIFNKLLEPHGLRLERADEPTETVRNELLRLTLAYINEDTVAYNVLPIKQQGD